MCRRLVDSACFGCSRLRVVTAPTAHRASTSQTRLNWWLEQRFFPRFCRFWRHKKRTKKVGVLTPFFRSLCLLYWTYMSSTVYIFFVIDIAEIYTFLLLINKHKIVYFWIKIISRSKNYSQWIGSSFCIEGGSDKTKRKWKTPRQDGLSIERDLADCGTEYLNILFL